MTESEDGVLSADEVRRIDARYRGLPAFAEWAGAALSDDLWQQAAAILAERTASVPSEVLDELVEQVMRTAAVDTGALEGLYDVDRGFTVSVSAMASAWQAEITQEKGADVAALVLAQRRAYDLALDAATGGTPISEAWVRRLHEQVCAAQDTYPVRTPRGPQLHELAKGAYKRYPNHIRKADGTAHAFAPVDDTPAEMHRLVEVLRSEPFARAHAVIQAAYAHYALAAIHPFADGNGRVARVLASVYLLRATSLPLVVWADQKGVYLDALAAADEGRPQRFVDFVLSQAVDLQLYLAESLHVRATPPIAASAERLGQIKIAPAEGPSDEEFDAAARRVIRHVLRTVEDQLHRSHLPDQVEWRGAVAAPGLKSPAGFPEVAGGEYAWFDVSVPVSPKERVTVGERFAVSRHYDRKHPFAVRLHRQGQDDVLHVRWSDIYPVSTQGFQLRLAAWINRAIAETLDRLATAAEAKGESQPGNAP